MQSILFETYVHAKLNKTYLNNDDLNETETYFHIPHITNALDMCFLHLNGVWNRRVKLLHKLNELLFFSHSNDAPTSEFDAPVAKIPKTISVTTKQKKKIIKKYISFIHTKYFR